MLFSFLFTLLHIFSCSESKDDEQLRYLALGDSYTIGESVTVDERWPVQLTERLRSDGVNIADPQIIATTGWTTDELQEALDEEDLETEFDMVSLLIGVNNQYRGYPIAQFESEFESLLGEAIIYARRRRDRVIVLSIPDYGVTPFGQTKDPQKIAKELDAYNRIAEGICTKLGVRFYGITEHSRLALSDESLVADDTLHPSGVMYKHWVDTVYPDVRNMFID